MNFLRNKIIGLLLCFGLLIPLSMRAGGDEDTVVESVARTGFAGLVIVLVAAGVHRIYTALKNNSEQQARLISVENGVQKLDGDLAAFKGDAKKDFKALLEGEETLKQGQALLLTEQAKLQVHVVQVKSDVAGARKDIATSHEVTTDVQKRVILLQQELFNSQDQLKRLADYSADNKIALAAVQLTATTHHTEFRTFATQALTHGDMSKIKTMVKEAVKEELDRVREECKSLASAPYGGEKALSALPAPRDKQKQVC